jgi:AcrR family transcriptional regulator
MEDRPLADTGSLDGDIRAVVQRAIALYEAPEVQAAALGFSEDLRSQPQLRRRLGTRVYTPAVLELRAVLDRAIERGELAPADAPDAATLLHTIVGAVVARLLLFGGDPEMLERDLVALLLHGLDGRRR